MSHLNEQFLALADRLSKRRILLAKMSLMMDFKEGPRALGQLDRTVGLITTRFEMDIETEDPDAFQTLIKNWQLEDVGFYLDQILFPEPLVEHNLQGKVITLTNYTLTLTGHLLA